MTLNIKLYLTTVIITLSLIAIISFFANELFKSNQMDATFNKLRAAISEGVKYPNDGTVDLEELLNHSGFQVFCQSAEDIFQHDSSPIAIEKCNPKQLTVEYPIYDTFRGSESGLISVSVWDNRSNLIQAIPESQIDYLESIQSKLGSTINWHHPANGDVIPDNYLYRLEPWEEFKNPENRPIMYGIPILDANKIKNVGFVLVHVNPYQNGWWDIALVMTLFLLPLAFIISSISIFFISRDNRKKILRIQQATSRWAKGNFDIRVPESSRDSLGQVGKNLNQMAQQLAEHIDTKTLLINLETRQELARDLHDAAKQQLFAATMQLTAANSLIDTAPSNARKHLDTATNLTKQAQQELASVIDELRPAQLQRTTFSSAVQALSDNFEVQNNIPVQLNLAVHQKISPQIEQALFRLLQEALSNIAKHSQATEVKVDLSAEHNRFELRVSDNGTGFEPGNKMISGFGLQSMQQRISNLQGTFEIKSKPNMGTTIVAKIDSPTN